MQLGLQVYNTKEHRCQRTTYYGDVLWGWMLINLQVGNESGQYICTWKPILGGSHLSM